MVVLLENIFQLSGVLLLICAIYYYIHFKKVRKKRKLTRIEITVYVVTRIAFFLMASSYLLLLLDKNY